jgi:putative membrane protein
LRIESGGKTMEGCSMMGYGGMMGGYGGLGGLGGLGGFGMGFGFLWQIFWLVIIAAVIYALISSGRGRAERGGGSGESSESGESTALEILKERLARGEIDYDEYVRIREGLKG